MGVVVQELLIGGFFGLLAWDLARTWWKDRARRRGVARRWGRRRASAVWDDPVVPNMWTSADLCWMRFHQISMPTCATLGCSCVRDGSCRARE
ncbi:hypothetical protein [Actinomadura napierensis]